jgi:hypothetical protein
LAVTAFAVASNRKRLVVGFTYFTLTLANAIFGPSANAFFVIVLFFFVDYA